MPQYPVYKGYSIEGNTLRIHFENLGKGFLHPDPVRGFIIAGTDRIFYPATVTVKKERNNCTITRCTSSCSRKIQLGQPY